MEPGWLYQHTDLLYLGIIGCPDNEMGKFLIDGCVSSGAVVSKRADSIGADRNRGSRWYGDLDCIVRQKPEARAVEGGGSLDGSA